MISFTEAAAKQILEMSQNSEDGKLLRIFIEPGGCSGFEYGMSMDIPKENDQKGENSGEICSLFR